VRWAVRIAAALAVPTAAVLLLLAVDALRVPDELAADDVRFEAAPRISRPLWTDLSLLPGDAGEHVLGVEDDVAFRRTAALYARIKDVEIRSPELEALSGQALLAVTVGSRTETDPRRRSELLNLLGVLTFDQYAYTPAEREILVRTGIGAFRNAIKLSSDNAEAKRNLELALRLPEAKTLSGPGPDAGASRGQRSGAGRSGSGY
jgi:hypothetical protein